jgi:serine/threonine protein kinase
MDGATSIDKYEIVRELGRGATSAVYLAYDSFTERQVAIKVFRGEVLADSEHGKHFQKLLANEASLVGRLNHPHIVGIYDASLGRDKNYIVMEYVEGETLERYCSPDSLLPIPQVVDVVFKCAMALDSAHRAGVIHRDIKPANIMLCAGGDVKIADFGAAVLTRSDQTQIVGVGSPLYMSPEQIRQEPLDPRTDLYSLGVVMYRLLTGRLPFEADTAVALSHLILNVESPDVRTLRPAIPQRIGGVVAKAMRKNRDERYANGMALAGDLMHLAKADLPGDAISELEKFEKLKALQFFRNFGDIDLWEVLRISVWGRMPANRVLIEENDEGDFFFIVADGVVEILRGGRLLGSQGAGSCFGEMCYIRQGALARTATVRTQIPATILKIKADSLHKASDACQLAFNRAFLDVLVDRLARTDAHVVSA